MDSNLHRVRGLRKRGIVASQGAAIVAPQPSLFLARGAFCSALTRCGAKVLYHRLVVSRLSLPFPVAHGACNAYFEGIPVAMRVPPHREDPLLHAGAV